MVHEKKQRRDGWSLGRPHIRQSLCRQIHRQNPEASMIKLDSIKPPFLSIRACDLGEEADALASPHHLIFQKFKKT